MADLNILILGKLDSTKTAQQMNQQLDEIQSKLKTLNIDLKIDQNVVNQMKNVNNNVQQTSQLIQQQTQDYVRQGAVIQATSEKIKIAKDGTQQWVGSQAKLLDAQGKQINLLENTKGLVETTTENFAEQALMAQKLVGTFNELKKDVISTGDIKGVIQQLNPGLSIEKLKPLDDWGKKWQATLSDGAKVSQAFKYQINSTTGELFAFDKGLENATNKNMGFVEQLKIAAARIPVWFIAMTGWVQLSRSVIGAFKYMSDLDKQMNQIAIVTGKSQRETSALALEYQKLAMTMGVTTKEIAQASVEFYRQGLDTENTMKRLTTSTQYAKISGLEFAEASQILTATVNSLSIPIERAADVMAYLGEYCPAA